MDNVIHLYHQIAIDASRVTRLWGSDGMTSYTRRETVRQIKNSEYDQEIPQSQTADYPVAPRGRAAQPSRDTRKTN